MLSATECYQTTISNVIPGTIFVALVGDQNTVCLAVEPSDSRYPPAFLALSPGHPMLRNRVGLMDASVISDFPLLVYPEAQFIPSPKREHLRLETYRDLPIGSLTLTEREFSIVAETGRGRAWFSCRDGSRIPSYVRGASKAAFISWEVMIQGPGGEPYPLCEIATDGVAS